MIINQCVYLDEENEAKMGVHCIEDNGDDFIVCLDRGGVIASDEIPYYHDIKNWDENFQTVREERDYLAENGRDLQEVQNLLENLVERFGAITISTRTGEFTINANDSPVYVIPD